MHRVLIVEDEPEIAGLIRNRLDAAAYDVIVVADGRDALAQFAPGRFDLVTLDVMLPGLDGLELCRAFREKDRETLILMITALGTEEDIEAGYGRGADDYIAKPFSPRTLALKIAAMLQRRSELRAAPATRCGVLELAEECREIRVARQPLSLTPSEYLILETLIRTPKRVFSRDDLAQVIYDNDLGSIDRRGIDTHICQLRKKIAALSDVETIRTVRQFGYTLHEH
jgi:DNA-binding response OmpR family regulator